MDWRVVTVGKPKLPYARLGIEEYTGRLRGFVRCELLPVRAGLQAAESAALLEASAGRFRVVLDSRGEAPSSEALAEKLAGWEGSRQRGMALLIGGAEGHTPELRAQADWRWSLGPGTLQHELAAVVALEQLYRAYTIKAGLPYHRA